MRICSLFGWQLEERNALGDEERQAPRKSVMEPVDEADHAGTGTVADALF